MNDEKITIKEPSTKWKINLEKMKNEYLIMVLAIQIIGKLGPHSFASLTILGAENICGKSSYIAG